MPLKRISMMPKIVEQGCIVVCLLSCSIAARKSLPYQPGSHTVIRKHRTDQAETVIPLEAKSSHRSAEYCTQKGLVVLEQDLIDFKNIVFAADDEKFHNHVEFLAVGQGI